MASSEQIPNSNVVTPTEVGVGQFRQVPSAHQHFRVGQARAHFAIARERLGEAEVDGIDNRVEDSAEAPLLCLVSGAIKGGEIAMLGRNQHRSCARLFGDRETMLGEAEKIIGASGCRRGVVRPGQPSRR